MKQFTYAIMLSLCFLLGACESTNDGKPLAQMTFSHLTPEPLYVASYEVVALPENRKPVMPMGFKYQPADIIVDYLKHRYIANGTTGKVRAVIENISVAHEILPSENQVGAALGIARRDRYKVVAGISIQGIGIGQSAYKSVKVNAHRDVMISEHVSIVQRERAQLDAMDELLDGLDDAIHKVLEDQVGVMDSFN